MEFCLHQEQQKQALIIGASSGIGEALARRLVRDGWRVIIAARRMERLQALMDALGGSAVPCCIDASEACSAQNTLEGLWQKHGHVDLVVISAGTGHINTDLAWEPERETLALNVLGFAAFAGAALRLFMKQGSGHLAGISSIARFRGDGEAPAYGASKAFVSVYLDGLRDSVKKKNLPVHVTELCPGFVDTAMMKTDKPFWVASPEAAADQMVAAIYARKKCSYITRRWALIAWLLRLVPRP